jgi:hypothetical protein
MKARTKPWKAKHLVYAAVSRCQCGAGLAYAPKDDAWDCSAVLLGQVAPGPEHRRYPFTFWEIKSELQPSARGGTTRP